MCKPVLQTAIKLPTFVGTRRRRGLSSCERHVVLERAYVCEDVSSKRQITFVSVIYVCLYNSTAIEILLFLFDTVILRNTCSIFCWLTSWTFQLHSFDSVEKQCDYRLWFRDEDDSTLLNGMAKTTKALVRRISGLWDDSTIQNLQNTKKDYQPRNCNHISYGFKMKLWTGLQIVFRICLCVFKL
jgi:hypothetical protein